MQLLAISLARLIAFTDIYEWSPRNAVPFYVFTKAFVERYGFLKFPQTLDEFDLENGVVFNTGMFGSVGIVGVTFFRNGIVVDTRSSTEEGENFLSDAGEWAEQFFGIGHSANRISRKAFLSQLTFHSEVPFDFINKRFNNLVALLNNVVSSYAQEPQHFKLFGLSFANDPPGRIDQSLRIERITGTPFWENKYFSSAPLPTTEHLKFLDEFESILSLS